MAVLQWITAAPVISHATAAITNPETNVKRMNVPTVQQNVQIMAQRVKSKAAPVVFGEAKPIALTTIRATVPKRIAATVSMAKQNVRVQAARILVITVIG